MKMIIMMTETNFREIEDLLNVEYLRTKSPDGYHTVWDYLQCFTPKIANEFFEESLKQRKPLSTPVSNMSGALNIIRWSKTTQGHEYWEKIHTLLTHRFRFNPKDFKTINIIEEDGEY